MTKIPMKRLKRFGIGTPPGKLGWDDAGKIAKGAGLAAIGAVAAIAATWLTVEDIDIETAGMAGLTAAFAVVANATRKFLSDTRNQ
jgi:hypothetical protein|tara:strand:+ start:381 stop:638 length:258 start_codon:yes stop_codon:yes gene_type:complete